MNSILNITLKIFDDGIYSRAYKQPSVYRHPEKEPQSFDAHVDSQSGTPQHQDIHLTEDDLIYYIIMCKLR